MRPRLRDFRAAIEGGMEAVLDPTEVPAFHAAVAQAEADGSCRWS